MRKDVVMLAAVDWKFIMQAQQIFARRFSERGFNVIYVEPFPQRNPEVYEVFKVLLRLMTSLKIRSKTNNHDGIKGPGVKVLTPVAFPETFKIFQYFNSKIMVPLIGRRIKKLCISKHPIVQCWEPLQACLELARYIDPSLLIYSCVENYPFMRGVKHDHIIHVEKELTQQADVVIVKSDIVAKRLRQYRPDIYRRDSAVDFSLFRKADKGCSKNYKKLCFFGAISDRLDFNIISHLADSGYEILLLGPERTNALKDIKTRANVQVRPAVAYEEVPEIIRVADCIILPYKLNDFTKSIVMAKQYECMATGKPIVSTRLPSLLKFKDMICFADNGAQFHEKIKGLEKTENEIARASRIEKAKKNSWTQRFQEELELIKKAIVEKELGVSS